MVFEFRPKICVFADEIERKNQSAMRFQHCRKKYYGFHGLGDMPNEFQRVMDSSVGHLPGVHVYLDDILIATRGLAERHWRELREVLEVLNENNAAVKLSKSTVFAKEIEWLGFKFSNTGTVPVERKSESDQNMKRPENISDLRSLIGLMNQFIRFIPNMVAATELFCDIM